MSNVNVHMCILEEVTNYMNVNVFEGPTTLYTHEIYKCINKKEWSRLSCFMLTTVDVCKKKGESTHKHQIFKHYLLLDKQ